MVIERREKIIPPAETALDLTQFTKLPYHENRPPLQIAISRPEPIAFPQLDKVFNNETKEIPDIYVLYKIGVLSKDDLYDKDAISRALKTVPKRDANDFRQ